MFFGENCNSLNIQNGGPKFAKIAYFSEISQFCSDLKTNYIFVINMREAHGVVVRTPAYGAEGRGIEPRQRQNLCDWKTLSVHPAVSGYLIQFRGGI